MNLVNVSRWVWFLIEACNLISCWDKWFVVNRDSVDCQDRDWSAERYFFLRFNTFSCSSTIVSSWVSIVIWFVFNLLSLLMWLTCRLIHCSLSFKVMSRWFLSSISILMILSDWSIAHWQSCWLMLMSHEIATFWDFAEALKEIRETRLLTVLLSKQAVRDSTDSESRVIVRKIKIDK